MAMKWLSKLFSKQRVELYHTKYEQDRVDSLFEEMEQAARKKRRLMTYVDELAKKEEALKKYDLLTVEDTEQLALLGGQCKALEEKRDLLRSRLIKNNSALYRLQDYEEKLPEMIKELGEVERQVRDSERDLFYLDEEREELLEERELLLKGYGFLKYFSGAFIVVMIIVLFTVFAMMQTLREEVWVYLSGVACVFVFFLVGIIFCKERLEKALKTNELLQKKAVKYSNKAKIRCFTHKNYLDFQFAKLGVDSVAKLELYYNRYIKSKQNEKTYGTLTNQLIQLERKIEELFGERGISIEHMGEVEEWLLAPKRTKLLKSVAAEKLKVEDQVKAIALYEEELWKEVSVLEQMPEIRQEVREKMKTYQDMMLTLDKESKTA